MAIQMSVLCRNARLNAIETYGSTSCSMEIRSGTPPSDCATAGSGTILATINLPSDWMNAAGSGQMTKNGTWQDASADNGGTAGHFRIYNSQATKDNTTCFMQGTCGQGSGDISFDNATFVAGQTVTISTFTLTDGNA